VAPGRAVEDGKGAIPPRREAHLGWSVGDLSLNRIEFTDPACPSSRVDPSFACSRRNRPRSSRLANKDRLLTAMQQGCRLVGTGFVGGGADERVHHA
jgi:hypothetical protein